MSLDPRQPDDWAALAEFFRRKLDRIGTLSPLSTKELEEAWTQPSTEYPQDFTVTPAQAIAWHRREAEACVKEKNPAAALFHTLHACELGWAVAWGWPRW